MKEIVKLTKDLSSITVHLDAKELSEKKLVCEISCEPDVRTVSGDMCNPGYVRVLCGSGIALARRKLLLAGGIQVTVTNICGAIESGYDTGICFAVAVAIARSLRKDDQLHTEDIDKWTVAD